MICIYANILLIYQIFEHILIKLKNNSINKYYYLFIELINPNMFAEYEHMPNLHNIKEYYEDPESPSHVDPSTIFIALEKIHGTNFSFISDGKTVTSAKRGSSLGTTGTFMNSGYIVQMYKDDVAQLFPELIKKYPTMKSFQLYGELFGGKYNGETEKGSKSIQKGVNYCPRNDFMAYDLRIITDHNIVKEEDNTNNFFLDFSEIDDIIKRLSLKIKLVPFITRGTFSEMIALNPVFETRVSSVYGLEPLPNNFAEGYVIKAEDEHKNPRIMFKHKNPSYLEVAVKEKVSHEKTVSYQGLCLEEMKRYITDNRFDNVYSKFSEKSIAELDANEISQLELLMYGDIIVDFKDDHTDPEDLTCNEPNIVRNERPLKGIIKGFVKKCIAK